MEDKVIDSREGRAGDLIRRRRECLKCGRRYTTYERIDEIPYMVIKKDGRRERFDRQKILQGLLKSCEKRPVPRLSSKPWWMRSSDLSTKPPIASARPARSANS